MMSSLVVPSAVFQKKNEKNKENLQNWTSYFLSQSSFCALWCTSASKMMKRANSWKRSGRFCTGSVLNWTNLVLVSNSFLCTNCCVNDCVLTRIFLWESLALKPDFAFTEDAIELFNKVNAGSEFKHEYPTTPFDERTILSMVLPIHFQNCKIHNLTSVRNLCACFRFLIVVLNFYCHTMFLYRSWERIMFTNISKPYWNLVWIWQDQNILIFLPTPLQPEKG